MKWILSSALLLFGLASYAQFDTIAVSEVINKMELQRYHEQPMRDTIVLFNDFDFGVMLGNIKCMSKGHEASIEPVNYLRKKTFGFLVLTATARSFVQPYKVEYELIFFSDRDSGFRHSKKLKLSIDYGS